jgi:hypothetical protein
MTQCTTMAAPEPPSTIEPDALATSLAVDDPSVVLALIAEVDAIFCAAQAPVCQRPAPPVVPRTRPVDPTMISVSTGCYSTPTVASLDQIDHLADAAL